MSFLRNFVAAGLAAVLSASPAQACGQGFDIMILDESGQNFISSIRTDNQGRMYLQYPIPGLADTVEESETIVEFFEERIQNGSFQSSVVEIHGHRFYARFGRPRGCNDTTREEMLERQRQRFNR